MLHTNAILVRLSIKMPPQTKLARSASDDVEVKYHTARHRARVNKSLFSKQDIQPLQKMANKVRTMFNILSLPYDQLNRIIPSTQYFDFVEKISELTDEFDVKRKKFLDDYHISLMRSEVELGDLFNVNDYPTPNELEGRVHLSIESDVIPPTNAFDELTGLSDEAIEELKSKAQAGQQAKVGDALKDLFHRLLTAVGRAATKLSDGDAIFRDTLIGNIEGAITAVETLNLTGNQELADLAKEAKAIVEGLSAQDLREDEILREETAESARELAAKMEEFF
jgi:hypothetical protein